MTRCFLALGSNLKHPRRELCAALQHLKALPKTAIIKKSRVYQSLPFQRGASPVYFNQVVAIETFLPPLQLLKYCHDIEAKQNRQRKIRWAPRTIDIDILFYGERTIHLPKLTIPHPSLYERDFVLLPLLEIAPSFQRASGLTQNIQNPCVLKII